MNVRDPGFFDLSRFTPAQMREARARMRVAREVANREDAGLFALQMAEAELDDAGVLDLEAGDELVFDPEVDGYVVVRSAR